MKTNTLFSLLQFAGGTFPTGAFSQSWGLETYVFREKIKCTEGFKEFLQMYIDKILKQFEGPIFCKAYTLADEGKLEEIKKLEETFLAMRLTKESREIVLKTGKAFMRIVSEMMEDDQVRNYYESEKERGISFPVAFAFVCARTGVGKKEALGAFMFSTISGLIQSGLKLIPLGNIEAQKLTMELYENIEEATDKAIKIPIEEAFAFCPGLDIASMCHETLPTRIYMT